MIRYRCPRCKKPLTAQDNEAGAKRNCPHCEQRVQIPVPPPPNKTMLGTLDDQANKTMLGAVEGPAEAPEASPPADGAALPPVPCTILVETASTEAPLDELEEVENARPRRRRRSRGYEDDDRRVRPHRPCPRCGCADYPRQTTKFGGASIALLIIGIFFWPLILVAFFIQEKWDVCAECGEKLRQTGTGI